MSHPLDRPTRARFFVLALLCLLSLITYLDRVCISRASDDIRRDLDFSATQMGLVFAAFSLGYALFEVPAGWMGDRWGSRRVLVRIVLGWSLFTALTGLVPRFDFGFVFHGLALMLVVRFLFGAGEAGAYPNMTRVIGDWFPVRERGGALGLIWTAARLGGAIAPLAIGRLSAAVGWRLAFVVLGVFGIAWAVAFKVSFRSKPEDHPGCNEAERRLIAEGAFEAKHDGHAWPGFGVFLRSVTVMGLCWASFFVCMGWYFFPTWQPLYLKEVHGFAYDDATAEFLTGLPFLCGACGAFIGGRISDFLTRRAGLRRGRALLGLIGFNGAGLCVLASGFAPDAGTAVFLLCLAFLINDLAIPAMWATCADVGGRYAGSLSGLMNSVGAFAAILTPLAIPSALDGLPEGWSAVEKWRVVFAGLAGAWFLAAIPWWWVDAGKRLEGA